MVDNGPAPSRADARRNRALVLQAARSAFEERGLAAPLGEIARRAGVGAGTVYRHFPSKEALFRASVADRMRLFADTATDLADAEDPGGVFFRFLTSVVRLSARNKALCDALAAAGEAGESSAAEAGRVGATGAPSGGKRGAERSGKGTERALGRARAVVPPRPEEDFLAALHVLLVRAQEAGAVREDVELGDVHALLVGCMSMERQRSGSGSSVTAPGRMTALMCDGLRADRAVSRTPTAPVTKLTPAGAENRNETGCAVCGRPVAAARTGRPARYCGGACRQKAHRARTQARRRPTDTARE
ncbi:TetR/AcrR family transcriptional regulator [Streptomyces sp. NPDC093589]|uniref:TetR/AcrR family transcriptional regulator n=1 Tax=Streptomyces sp. NPDC093589 TaxID=3366043 RepID=UPI003810E30D